MRIKQISILYSLFFKASNKTLKISLFLLPIIISFSFASILFINNLSVSYKNYLLKSYIGIQGIVTIRSTDQKYLDSLQNSYNSLNINSSLKLEKILKLTFKIDNFSITKDIKVIVLENRYLKQKFSQFTNILINNVFKNILGDYRSINIKNIKTNKYIKLNNLNTMDTGFLTNEPLIFISKDFYKTLGFNSKIFNKLEVDCKINDIKSISSIAYKTSEDFGADIDIKDILSSNKKTQMLFDNIKYIEYLLLIITIILSSVILIAALSIISTLKAKAISLLRIYGLSNKLISYSLALLSGILLVVSFCLAFIIFDCLKIYFLDILSLKDSFFLPLGYDIYRLIFCIILVFTIIIYVWAFYKFKGKINL
jgi:ABC-type lipoprotein release transport system permease subunit